MLRVCTTYNKISAGDSVLEQGKGLQFKTKISANNSTRKVC
jgi:hypothetical protein